MGVVGWGVGVVGVGKKRWGGRVGMWGFGGGRLVMWVGGWGGKKRAGGT